MHKEFGVFSEFLAGMCLAAALDWCYDVKVEKNKVFSEKVR